MDWLVIEDMQAVWPSGLVQNNY